MKVLMLGWEFPPYFAGGFGVVAEALTRALGRRGVDVDYVMPHGAGAGVGERVRLLGPGSSGGSGRLRVAAPRAVTRAALRHRSGRPQGGSTMDTFDSLARRLAAPALRLSLAVVLLWIGALKFVDPTPVVGLLEASFSFLAYPGVVYALGAVEVIAAGLLAFGVAQPVVGLLCMGLFSGTLAIFAIAPAVSFGAAGFPNLSLAGQFLLKDLVLFAASLAVAGLAPLRSA